MKIHIEVKEQFSKNRAYVEVVYKEDEFLKRCNLLPRLDSVCKGCRVFKVDAWRSSENGETIFYGNVVGNSLQDVIQKIEDVLK